MKVRTLKKDLIMCMIFLKEMETKEFLCLLRGVTQAILWQEDSKHLIKQALLHQKALVTCITSRKGITYRTHLMGLFKQIMEMLTLILILRELQNTMNCPDRLLNVVILKKKVVL